MRAVRQLALTFPVEERAAAVALGVCRDALVKFGTVTDENRVAVGQWCKAEVTRRLNEPAAPARIYDHLRPSRTPWPPQECAPEDPPPF
jgi:hypothetical protein